MRKFADETSGCRHFVYTQFMATTTIRVSTETHRLLGELAAQRDQTLTQTVRDAAEALRRRDFVRGVAADLDELRREPAAWQAYLEEADATHVSDGVG